MKLGSQQLQQDPGDDRAVLRVHARWCETLDGTLNSTGAPRCHVHRLSTGEWQLVLAIQRGPNKRQRHFVAVDPEGTRTDRWPLLKLADGVWDLPVSIAVEGQFHGFVTLLDVPSPAPWERS